MSKIEKFSLKKRWKSFSYAFDGIKTLLKEEHNARIHLVAAFGVIVASIYLNISLIEWCLVVLCVVMIISAEAVNSAVENLTDLASPEYHPLARKAKDLAAAAVLIIAFGVAIIGGIIFLPKLYELLINVFL